MEAIRGEQCLLLTPWCENGPAVPCHSNWHEDGKGRGRKADDLYVAAGCYACHKWLDEGMASRDEKREVFHTAFPSARATRQFVFHFTDEILDVEKAPENIKATVYRILWPIFEMIGVNLGSHAVCKYALTWAWSNGITKYDKDHRGCWKNSMRF